MGFECFAECIRRGKSQKLRNDMDKDAATELIQRHFHAPTVKILLGGDVICFGKFTRDIFAGISEFHTEMGHIKRIVGEVVEIGFDEVGNVGILLFLLTEL